ncbi:MAG: hypothetical protein IT269_06100 [Saprospiraceae bacterium]|nr:hypothetical protein [Saprospiraceae bacterium]
MNFKPFYFLFVLALVTIAACQRENIDELIVNVDPITPDTIYINCDTFDLTINTTVYHDTITLTALPSKGWGPYGYSWSNGQSTQSIIVANNNTYAVTVTDLTKGCITSGQVAVDTTGSNCSSLVVALSYNSSGQLSASPSGGTLPYSYYWSFGDTTSSITPNFNGNYTVTVTDANGCVGINNYDVDVCSNFFVTMSDSIGMLFALPVGGNSPYHYHWNLGETTQSITPAFIGFYSVTVTNNNGCVFVNSINHDLTGDPCASLNVGIKWNTNQLSGYGYGGTPPYTFLWSNGDTNQTINAQTGLTYTATITDAAGCTAQNQIEL